MTKQKYDVEINGVIFTPTEIETMAHIAERTWNAIGSDCLEMTEDGTMDGFEVAEMVFDANRWEDFSDDKENDMAIYKKMLSLGYGSEHWNAFISIILPYAHYGY